MSRRWFVAAVSGVAGVASAAVWWRRRHDGAGREATRAVDALAYVDRDGWMITPADKRRLDAGATAVEHGR
jgi:hypothetical protein